ncbi:MAG: hypothetical protein WBF08_09610 [Candidatus Bathyarchaeia archaeon]
MAISIMKSPGAVEYHDGAGFPVRDLAFFQYATSVFTPAAI